MEQQEPERKNRNAEYKKEYGDMLQWYWHHCWIIGNLLERHQDYADVPSDQNASS